MVDKERAAVDHVGLVRVLVRLLPRREREQHEHQRLEKAGQRPIPRRDHRPHLSRNSKKKWSGKNEKRERERE